MINNIIRKAIKHYFKDKEEAIRLYGPIEDWDTENVTDMSFLFADRGNFNVDIGNWNTSNVTTMYNMFKGAYRFNQDISRWNVSKVVDMYGMFCKAYRFNQNLVNWNFNKNVYIKNMLSTTYDFFQDISRWNIPCDITYHTQMYSIINQSAMEQKIMEHYSVTEDFASIKKYFNYERRKHYLQFLIISGFRMFNGDFIGTETNPVFDVEDLHMYIATFL